MNANGQQFAQQGTLKANEPDHHTINCQIPQVSGFYYNRTTKCRAIRGAHKPTATVLKYEV